MAQVVRCTDCGAYYNGQYYSVCPHCKKGHAESVPKPEQTDAPQKPDVKKDEPSVYVPPQRGETRAYSDMPPEWKEVQEPLKTPKQGPAEELAPDSDEPEPPSNEPQPLFTALRNSGRTIGRFSSAAENGVDPVVGWLVCVKGPYYGQSFPRKSGKNRIGRAQSMDVRLLNDSSVSRDCVAVIVYDAKIGDFSVIPGDSDSLCYWNEAAVYAREQLAAYDTLELGDSGRNAFIFVPLCGERFSWADRQPDEARRD